MKKTIQAAAAVALLVPMTAFGAEAAAGEKKTLIDTYIEGGWVMHILLLCSIAMVWLIIDIWMRTNRPKMTPPEDVSAAQDLFRAAHVAIGLGQCFLAFHHRCVGLGAQFAHHRCSNRCHVYSPKCWFRCPAVRRTVERYISAKSCA